MSFLDIPIRQNGQNVDSSWWNSIRSKLVATLPGLSDESEEIPLANNQSSYADVTGIILDSLAFRTYEVPYTVYRVTSTTERAEKGVLNAVFKPVLGEWVYSRRTDAGDNTLNVPGGALHVDASTGQLQYKTDNMSGSDYEGFIKLQLIGRF